MARPKGFRCSENQRENISQGLLNSPKIKARRGVPLSEKTIQAIRSSRLGVPHTIGAKTDASVRYARHRVRHPLRVWANATFYYHKSKGFTMQISKEQLEYMAQTNDKCFLCGRILNYSQTGKNGIPHRNSPSLDRLDNTNVLALNNVAIVCHDCNRMKRERTLIEFIHYCGAVYLKFQHLINKV